MRDRLIELLMATNECEGEQCTEKGKDCQVCLTEKIADYLLANGVIVPPCKVGDNVWFNTYEKNATFCVGIQPHKVDRIDVVLVCGAKKLIPTKIESWEIGKTAFFTREEAEAKLKGEQ